MQNQQTTFDDLRLDSPIRTAVSSDTVEDRGRAALRLLNGSPCFTDEHAAAGARWSADRKVDVAALRGEVVDGWTIGEALAVYLEVFEREAHADMMADRITRRQYAARVSRLRNKIIARD